MSLLHSPDAAIVTLILGILLIYLELNRPGTILPGALGLLLTLLAAAGLHSQKLNPNALLLLVVAAIFLLLSLRTKPDPWLTAAATLNLMAGFGLLTRSPRVHPLIAIVCGLILGAGTSVLTRIARRARVNKGLD